MSWASREVEDWTKRARELAETADGEPAVPLEKRLDLLGEGFRIRQATDARSSGDELAEVDVAAREGALRATIALQQAVIDQLDAEAAAESDAEAVALGVVDKDEDEGEPAP